MKLFNQFNVLPRYLTAFNYAGLNLNETPKELEKCTPKFQNFWDKECREHPTNQNCLIYCDWTRFKSESLLDLFWFWLSQRRVSTNVNLPTLIKIKY